MHFLMTLFIALHVLAGVFWAGSTFVLARTGGVLAARLAFPQLGAAATTVVAGAVTAHLLFHGAPDAMAAAKPLAVGALCALAAFAVQASALPAVRRLRAAGDAVDVPRRIVVGQRLAAVLLAVTVFCMATWRYL